MDRLTTNFYQWNCGIFSSGEKKETYSDEHHFFLQKIDKQYVVKDVLSRHNKSEALIGMRVYLMGATSCACM